MANIRWVKSTARECTNGLTDLLTTSSGIMEIYRAKVFTNGPMEGGMKENGTKI